MSVSCAAEETVGHAKRKPEICAEGGPYVGPPSAYFPESVPYFLSLRKILADSASVAGCYNERGVMHYLLDEFVVAEKFLQRALTINRAQRNLKEIATNLNNLCLPTLFAIGSPKSNGSSETYSATRA